MADASVFCPSSYGLADLSSKNLPGPPSRELYRDAPVTTTGLWTPWHGNWPAMPDGCSASQLHDSIQALNGNSAPSEHEHSSSYKSSCHPMLKSRHGSSVSLFSDGEAPAMDNYISTGGYHFCQQQDTNQVEETQKGSDRCNSITLSSNPSESWKGDCDQEAPLEDSTLSNSHSQPLSTHTCSTSGNSRDSWGAEAQTSHAAATNVATRHLWLGNIPLKPNRTAIEDVFGSFGALETIRVFPGKTYAFVNFFNADQAARAKASLDGVALPAITGSRAFIIRFQPDTSAAAAAAKQEAKSGPGFPGHPLLGVGRGRAKLSNCLNPNNSCFDPELAECYRRMSKHDKEILWSYERQVYGDGDLSERSKDEQQAVPVPNSGHRRSTSGAIYGSSLEKSTSDLHRGSPPAATWFSSSPSSNQPHQPVQHLLYSGEMGPGVLAHNGGITAHPLQQPKLGSLGMQEPRDLQVGAQHANLLAQGGGLQMPDFVPTAGELSGLLAILSAPSFSIRNGTMASSQGRPPTSDSPLTCVAPATGEQHDLPMPDNSAGISRWLYG
eukprot:CAMPEP_0117655404 /NCGR_PEP_ID=MMETSP0804-20121206/4260_1 /TAXON_ID=1074897 /ORGANISM="Tetraselmis astigmatica, Strain CCMP880" /LENGTH=552 /DNA_ID=CAMNT_0005461751 /DNA_START=399 /DNA_END=2057 /DNA_ORIENTATION=+